MSIGPFRALAPMIAAILLAGSVAAEARGVDASTRLRRCGAETCLLVTGRRSDAAAPVLVAGHRVGVEGGRRWRVAVPMRLVRDWSAPAARSIAVEVAGRDGAATQAPLPIGVLGHVTELALLDVGAPH